MVSNNEPVKEAREHPLIAPLTYLDLAETGADGSRRRAGAPGEKRPAGGRDHRRCRRESVGGGDGVRGRRRRRVGHQGVRVGGRRRHRRLMRVQHFCPRRRRRRRRLGFSVCPSASHSVDLNW